MSCLLVVFCLLVFTTRGLSYCTIPTEGRYVYIEHKDGASNNFKHFEPREDEPNPSSFVHCTSITSGCCTCNGGNYSICPTLDTALNYTSTEFNGSHVYISLMRSNWKLYGHYEFKQMQSLVIQSFSGTSASITCASTNSTGIIVTKACNVYLVSVYMSGCGHGTVKQPRRGALTLTNVAYLNVEKTTFFNNVGTGLMIAVEDNFTNYVIDNCTNDGYYMYNYTINNSEFVSNGVKAKFGGGVYITIQAENIIDTSAISITNSRFTSNTATIGGGLYYESDTPYPIQSYQSVFTPSLKISQCIFHNNSATLHGGALYYSGSENTIIESVNFTDNRAAYTAGGVYQYTENVPSYSLPVYERLGSHVVNVLYNNCRWDGNIAPGSSALLLFSPSNITASKTRLENCTFNGNLVTQSYFSGQAACIIHAQNVPLYFSDVTMSHSNGTALCIQSTYVYFNGASTFASNNGFFGGAAFIDHANFLFQSGSNVTFIKNHAVYGGAIYQNSLTQNNCIFQFNHTTRSDISVRFQHNQAVSNGDSIYFQNPNMNCDIDVSNRYVVFAPNNSDQYSSGAFKIDFHWPVMSSNNTMRLILGQKIIFNATIQNYFNQTSYAQINLFLRSKNSSSFFNSSRRYHLNGFRQFTIADGINYPNIHITGPEINETTDEYILDVESLHVSKTINLQLTDCPLGYQYNSTTMICECFNAPDGIVKCNPDQGTACIAVGYWTGMVDSGNAISTCSSGYCQSSTNECTRCSILDSDDDYCLLPHTADQQCLDNRYGRLCAYCKDGYAFTFSSSKCVPDSTCSQGQGIVPPLLNIFFLIITFIIIILVLKFDYRLSSGYMFCFVYYFSIVGHLLPPSIVGDTLLEIVSVFESVTQLNPQFLGHVPICFSTILTVLQQKVILYINPLIISIFVLATIGLSKCCAKYLKFKDNTLIKAICLLLLLSFTALTETSFNVMNGISFEGTHVIYVTIQPETRYFDLKNHLPWLIIGFVVMLTLVIPFTLLLLFAPLLSRLLNMNKVKPFLDEFQGCYKDNFRWMAGYYFLCRFIYFFILAIPSGALHASLLQYIIQLLSFAILVIHMLLQPYQSAWLNFSDSLLLADLTLLTLIFGETGDSAFGRDSPIRQIIVYFLIFIPVFYLIVIIAVTAGRRFNAKDRLEYRQQRRRQRRKEELRKPLISTTIINRDDEQLLSSNSVSIDYRDPVLNLLDSHEDRYNTLTSSSSPLSTENEQVTSGRHRRVTYVTHPSSPSPVGYSVVDIPALRSGSKSRTTSQEWQGENDIISEDGEDL